jgi:hypothetical protein
MGRSNWRARRSLIATHRALGLVASLFVIVLSLTGLLLNHPESFEFLDRPLQREALLRWYGLTPEGELTSYPADGHVGSSLDRGIYLDDRYVAASDTPLIGVARLDWGFALATPDVLWMVNLDETDGNAAVIDRMDSASLPGGLSKIGIDASGRLVVQTRERVFRGSEDLLSWHEADPESVAWSEPSEASEALRSAILRQFRGEGLLWSRLIADIHTGRFLGRYGVWLMDGASVVLLLLVATGLRVARTGRRP